MASTQGPNIHVGSAADELTSATTQALEASSITHRAGADGTQELAAPLNTQPDDIIPENLTNRKAFAIWTIFGKKQNVFPHQ